MSKENFENFCKTRSGLISRIYSSQKHNSKRRGHNPPEYTKTELQNWFNENPLFEILFKEWEKSNFDTMKKPSVDRIDCKIGYKISNIQLMTWGENKKKGSVECSGKNSNNYKPESFYYESPVTRQVFKRTCANQGWDFEDFTEIWRGDKINTNKKYYYKRR